MVKTMFAWINVSLVVFLSFILLWHSTKIRGCFNTLILAVISGGIGILVEHVGVSSGGYTYTGQDIVMMTLFTGFGWIANTLMALHIAAVLLNIYNYNKLLLRKIMQVGFATGLVGVAYDLFTDPVATALKVWTWAYSGPWFGVPTGNFIGWFVILACSSIGYYLSISYGHSKVRVLVLAGIFVIVGALSVIAIMTLCLNLGIK